MQIEYDPVKDRSNREKDGVSLEVGSEVFKDDDHLIVPSIRVGDGEERLKAIGLRDGKLWTCVFVRREDRLRFISVRRSNDKEARLYFS